MLISHTVSTVTDLNEVTSFEPNCWTARLGRARQDLWLSSHNSNPKSKIRAKMRSQTNEVFKKWTKIWNSAISDVGKHLLRTFSTIKFENCTQTQILIAFLFCKFNIVTISLSFFLNNVAYGVISKIRTLNKQKKNEIKQFTRLQVAITH